MTEYASIFTMSDMDLGKTSLAEHSIRLTDNTPFKECYQQIHEVVREHLKDVLEIGAIQPLCSPWASPVVLVHKKDGMLQFCINLKKLNACMIKDSYSLLLIEDTLDRLNGAVCLTALDIKSGNWQVEMDEASKPLMA